MSRQHQLGSPKLRNSVNTNVDVPPSFSSQRTENLAATSISERSSGIVTATRTHPSSSSPQKFPSSSAKVMDLPSAKRATVPLTTAAGQFPPPLHSTTIRGFSVELCHLSTAFQNLSVDERMFVIHLHTWGVKTAKRIAATLHYKLQRPLPELLAMTSELDKNCNARSVTHKQPLGS